MININYNSSHSLYTLKQAKRRFIFLTITCLHSQTNLRNEISIYLDFKLLHIFTFYFFQARNLQYAVSHPTPNYTTLVKEYPDVFILHLDEETLVTYEAMLNCMKFCHDGKFRFGHGMITYGWNKVTSPLATFCDNWRCACDAGVVYATCRLFHRCPLIKGGFFIMRNDLEELIGWDFGPHITGEDLHLGRLLFNMAEPADVSLFVRRLSCQMTETFCWNNLIFNRQYCNGAA